MLKSRFHLFKPLMINLKCCCRDTVNMKKGWTKSEREQAGGRLLPSELSLVGWAQGPPEPGSDPPAVYSPVFPGTERLLSGSSCVSARRPQGWRPKPPPGHTQNWTWGDKIEAKGHLAILYLCLNKFFGAKQALLCRVCCFTKKKISNIHFLNSTLRGSNRATFSQ